MRDTSGLVLYNANVITLDPHRPRARAVACQDGIITLLDDVEVSRGSGLEGYEHIDCGGRTMLPGFIDAHVHFLAYASSLTAVDCSPSAVSSIGEIASALRERAKQTAEGGWVRGAGYDEFRLAEKRHPTRWDLDPATPDHPVKLGHRSGHGVALNSRAMELARVTLETPEPMSGYIDRDVSTGEPTGLFIDLDDWLDERLGAEPRGEELEPAARWAAQEFLAKGITSFNDASPCNSLQRWEFFKKLTSGPEAFPRATLMPGYQHLREFVEAGLGFGAGDDWLRVGHCKIVISQAGGAMRPSPEELKTIVREAAEFGFPSAIHAVEESEVEAAVATIESVGRSGLNHRVEHASVCPPHLIERMKAQNVTVVTQPGFIHHSGDRYLERLSQREVANLYPLRGWLEAGLAVAGSSDAPVAPPDPLTGIQTSVTRRAGTGALVSPRQGISVEDALELHGPAGARVSGLGGRVGAVKKGALADFAILDDDPTFAPADEIGRIRVWAAVVGGRVAAQSEGS